MTYERRKRFVLDALADEEYRLGINIIAESSGLLRKSTAYQTFDRMENENLIRVKGIGRAWEREYRKAKPWENK